MSLFNSPTTHMLNLRLGWLNKRGQVLASNIARGDIHNAKRQELKSFKKILARQHNVYKGKTFGEKIQFDPKDTLETKTEISRPTEIMEMNYNTVEHDALLNIVKSFHRMARTLMGKSGG